MLGKRIQVIYKLRGGIEWWVGDGASHRVDLPEVPSGWPVSGDSFAALDVRPNRFDA